MEAIHEYELDQSRQIHFELTASLEQVFPQSSIHNHLPDTLSNLQRSTNPIENSAILDSIFKGLHHFA